ncbi:MAG: ADP compounds hydrolase NudE [Gammaproteobacteria bacterium]
MAQKPTLLDKKTLARTRYFHIEELHLEFSNGQRRCFERLSRGHAGGGAVLIVPLLNNDTVLLVREYAAGLNRYELGLPKGKIEAGETILDSANRELKEEVGYGARRLFHITTLSLAPSYLEHCTEIVVAEDLYAEKLPGDEPEELEVVAWNLNDLAGLLASGECSEARSIAALFLTQQYLAGK